MTEVKCCLGVLEIRGGEVGPPGEGVCMALSAGVLSQKGPSELEPGSGWALALGWSDPPGSRAELLLLALSVFPGEWFQDLL